MTAQRNITIAYHEANTKAANALVESLRSTNVSFEHFICREGNQNPDYNQLLHGLQGEVLLLVTDNYLKSESAMMNALGATQGLIKQNTLQILVLDGLDENKNPVTTVYSRIGEIINYMNFWQEQYLALRQRGRKEGKISDELEIKTNKVRTISTNIGEYLRFLRDQPAWTFDQLKATAFKPLLEKYQINGMVEETAFAKLKNTPVTKPTKPDAPVQRTATIPSKPTVEASQIAKEPAPTPNIQQKNPTTLEEISSKVPTPSSSLNVKSNPIPNPTPNPTPNPIEVPESTSQKEAIPVQKNSIPPIVKAPEIVKSAPPIAKTPSFEKQPPLKPEPSLKPKMESKSETKAEKQIQEGIKKVIDDFPSEEIDLDLSAIPGIGMLNRHIAGNTKSETRSESKPESKLSSDDMGDLEINVPDFSINKDAAEKPKAKIGKKEKKEEKTKKTKVKVKVQSHVKDAEAKSKDKKKTTSADKKIKFGIPNFPEVQKIKKSKESEFPQHKMVQVQNWIVEGNYASAQKELEKLTAKWPRKAILWKQLGEIAEIQSDYLQAGTHYSRAIELDSTLPEINYKLGLIISNYQPDQIDKAISHFDKAIEMDSNHVDAYYQLGVLLNENKRNPKEAVPIFEKVLDLDSDHEFANYDLALIYFDKSEFDTAKDYYLRAFKNNEELRTNENDLAFGVDKLSEKEISKKKKKRKDKKQNLKNTSKKGKKKRKKKLVDQTVLITGATSGIGKATAKVFVEAGYRVILTGRREDRLIDLQQKFSKLNPNVRISLFDVRDVDACAEALNDLEGKFSEIDILINNAGLAAGFDPINDGNLQDWDRMIDTNVKGLLHMVRLVSPQMVERKTGHIINICSTAGHEVYPNGNVYCATKHAVDALTRAIRLDLYKHGIRVSQVSPAHVEETEFAKIRFHQDLEKAAIYDDFNPLRSPDVGATIFWIATQPAHVNVQDVVLLGTQQASSNFIDRSGRKFD